ncbi:hypothetical protein CYLTODRAFT_417056 [Cylindrobasidium torrendii FP15055 ss-10]|uniref:Exocyst complex component EXO84 n=1 Tax=Cylindrobasidium torrendii FP15055 ss-10 TaxID=1314674 RepID=A0A0D7BSZ3_9AGAR|nr:hypothetical protein CYLTODRAFT_417056 [Cylindrobasidium torrendii FP15055 ss-10]
MQSLRTRRSQAPAARTQPQRSGTKTKSTKRTGDARKSRVDDRIKKRMSMRYADISGPVDVPPPMPTMPSFRAGPALREEDAVYTERPVPDAVQAADEDKKLLDQDDFDADSYLRQKMANSTEAEVKSLQSSLRGAKEDLAADLQKSVFKNYAEFVLISKEISTLENEMLELKESLNEYKSMPSLLHIPDPTTASSSNISAFRRSSVADLRVMYYNQMQTLHAQIEGSAKFCPITTGRHVVSEVDGILSLNAATFKVMGKIKFVVLDDMVLVAKRRRRNAEASTSRGAAEGKLVADRCWPLHEMLVLDTKDSPSMTNVFKIKHGKETHVYRTETPSEKKGLLAQLRHVAEELAVRKRKEREGEHERRKSMWQGGASLGAADRSSAYNAEWMEFAGRETASNSTKEKTESDALWASEWADDLTVAIALKEWEKATKLAEEGRVKLVTIPALGAKLPPLVAQLTNALLAALAMPDNKKSSSTMLIGLLLRLNAGAAAKTTFLKMRSQVIKDLIRKIRFEGHIGAYIGDLAIVVFTAIKHSADWFLASFKDNENASTFIDWAKLQIEMYGEIFRKQVYSSDVESKVIQEAQDVTYAQSRKLLEEYGLDFRFLLDEMLAAGKVASEATIAPARVTMQDIQRQVKSRPAKTATPKASTQNLPRRSPTPTSTPVSHSSSTSSAYDGFADIPPVPAIHRARSPSTSTNGSYQTPPLSASSSRTALGSPTPRRTRTPPPPSGSRDRPPRSTKASPAPPPRSTHRPGSASGSRPAPAVPQRDGMF